MFTIITVQNIRVSLLVLFTHCFCSHLFYITNEQHNGAYTPIHTDSHAYSINQ